MDARARFHSQYLIFSVCGTAFEAGTDTTAGTLLFFVVAMLHYPEVLKKAQEEIDSVVGSDGSTIPGFIHINDLPYCFALTKEVFRYALFRIFLCGHKFLMLDEGGDPLPREASLTCPREKTHTRGVLFPQDL